VAIRDEFKRVHGGRYKFVKRGPVVWAKHDFQAFPFAVCFMFDECDLFPDENGKSVAIVGFELMAAISGNDIDDGLLDEMFFDVRHVIRVASSSIDEESQMPLITRRFRDLNKAVEVSDSDRGVQGLVTNVKIEF
jgi:hypothetical protein